MSTQRSEFDFTFEILSDRPGVVRMTLGKQRPGWATYSDLLEYFSTHVNPQEEEPQIFDLICNASKHGVWIAKKGRKTAVALVDPPRSVTIRTAYPLEDGTTTYSGTMPQPHLWVMVWVDGICVRTMAGAIDRVPLAIVDEIAWSPLGYGNVHDFGDVCWGHVRDIRTITPANPEEVIELFWNTEFNRDLAQITSGHFTIPLAHRAKIAQRAAPNSTLARYQGNITSWIACAGAEGWTIFPPQIHNQRRTVHSLFEEIFRR